VDLQPGYHRTGRPRRVVLGLLLGLCVLAAGLAVAVYFGVVRATEAPVLEVLAFLERTRAGDFAGARAHLAQGYQAEMTEERLRALAAARPECFGALDATFRDRKIRRDLCTLRGTVTTPSGTAQPAEFELLREDRAWRIAFWKWSWSEREKQPPH
jgi:hypothetical protein